MSGFEFPLLTGRSLPLDRTDVTAAWRDYNTLRQRGVTATRYGAPRASVAVGAHV